MVTITVVDPEGEEVGTEEIRNDADYFRTLHKLCVANHAVVNLYDANGDTVDGFSRLEDGGKYTLGIDIESQLSPEDTVWNHLNIALPPMDYDRSEVNTQQKSTTEYAAYSSTPLSVTFWSDFDEIVQNMEHKEGNGALVRSNIRDTFRKIKAKQEPQLIMVTVRQEEDVPQNTVRLLQVAAGLLGTDCIAGNKYVTANTDITVLQRIDEEEGPTNRAQHMNARKMKVLLPLETKPKWKYEFLLTEQIADDYFAQEFEVPNPAPPEAEDLPDSWSKDKKRVFHLMRQVFGQMKHDKLCFGCFHIYNFWWFCKMTNEADFMISRRYNSETTSPSVLQGFKTLVCMDQHRLQGDIADHAQSPIKKRKKSQDSNANLAMADSNNPGGGDGNAKDSEKKKKRMGGNDNNTKKEGDDLNTEGSDKKTSGEKSQSDSALTVSALSDSTVGHRTVSCHTVRTTNGHQAAAKAPEQASCSGNPAETSPPKACDVKLWDCTLLDSLTWVKILSTKCGSGFVKMVRDPRMEQAVTDMEQEAAIYEFVQEKKDPDCEAVPEYYGMSDHVGVPLLVLGMEGPSFEEIGLENLSMELKESAVKSLECLSAMGILHGDIALRNVVQSKSNEQKAKIIDFGHSVMCSDRSLLDRQVQTLKKLLTPS